MTISIQSVLLASLLVMSTAFADSATEHLGISAKFPGKYMRVEAVPSNFCPQDTVVVTATDAGLTVTSPDDPRYPLLRYQFSDQGCKRTPDWYVPNSELCWEFSDRKVSFVQTDTYRFPGHIRWEEDIRLGYLDSDILVMEKDVTDFISGSGNEGEHWEKYKQSFRYKCTYKRIAD